MFRTNLVSAQRAGLVILALGSVLVGESKPARAAFHLWDITEVFSNADGSIQYIELFTASGGQEFLDGHSIRATSTTGASTTIQVYNFSYDLSGGSTANERFLIATPGFANLPGARTPDYVLPCGQFFDPAADTIEINFGPNQHTVTFTSAQLPTDGIQAIDASGTAIPNSPEPFLDSAGSLSLTACQISGSCDACDDGVYCNGAETCSGTGCGTSERCPGELCDEAADACVECIAPSDCNDGNPCTDDVCSGGACANPNNSDACDDGLFCTATDVCAGGSCGGSGDPCSGGDLCSEAMNDCVECLAPGDCSDGVFCNGAETCTLGSCGDGNPPCVGDELCDESGDACVECLATGDCDDANPCTDDACNGGSCAHTNNGDTCDDGLFCTATDVCTSGACTGSGDACPGQNCLEGGDTCGDCTVDGDCDDGNVCTVNTCDTNSCAVADVSDGSACADDGLFCDGSESCQAGACTGDGDPCAAGSTCDDALDACRSGCGDAIVAGAEDCDDGNLNSGDGCDGDCALETGYACTTEGNASVCSVVHGDGIVAGDEACDDGNGVPDDGCFEGEVDTGWLCVDASPSVCSEETSPADSLDAGAAADASATPDAAVSSDAGGADAGRDAGGDDAGSASGAGTDAATREHDDAGDTGEASAEERDDGGGCSCRASGRGAAGSALPWLAALLVLAGRMRGGSRRRDRGGGHPRR